MWMPATGGSTFLGEGARDLREEEHVSCSVYPPTGRPFLQQELRHVLCSSDCSGLPCNVKLGKWGVQQRKTQKKVSSSEIDLNCLSDLYFNYFKFSLQTNILGSCFQLLLVESVELSYVFFCFVFPFLQSYAHVWEAYRCLPAERDLYSIKTRLI